MSSLPDRLAFILDDYVNERQSMPTIRHRLSMLGLHPIDIQWLLESYNPKQR